MVSKHVSLPVKWGRHATWRRVVLVMVVAVALYVVVPQYSGLKHGLSLLVGARLKPFLMAAGLILVTYLVAAASYCLLAIRPLPFWRTALIQGAGGFANRLLPAGIGGLGLNAAFLRSSKHTTAQATGVVLINNLLGMIGHLTLLTVVISTQPIGNFHIAAGVLKWLKLALAGLCLLALTVLMIYGTKKAAKIRRQLKAFLRAVKSFRNRPARLELAFLCAVTITLLNVLGFYLCCRAVGLDAPLGAVFVAFTAGMAATLVTPTPGGLGGAEAGLTAGLVAFSVPADAAVAAGLLYRLLVFWLPLAPGFVLFDIALKRRYVD